MAQHTQDLTDVDPDAELLFGYPPKRLTICIGCGRSAEPYYSRYCWLCTNAGAPLPGGRRMCVAGGATPQRKRGVA